jgi:hypothetical protein
MQQVFSYNSYNLMQKTIKSTQDIFIKRWVQHAPGLAFQKSRGPVVWTLRKVVCGHSFAGWILGLLLLLVLLRNHRLEFEESYPLRCTYCMNAQ